MSTPEAKSFAVLLETHIEKAWSVYLPESLIKTGPSCEQLDAGEELWFIRLFLALPKYAGPDLRELSRDGFKPDIRSLNNRFVSTQRRRRRSKIPNDDETMWRWMKITTEGRIIPRRHSNSRDWEPRYGDLRPRSVLLAANLGNPLDELFEDEQEVRHHELPQFHDQQISNRPDGRRSTLEQMLNQSAIQALNVIALEYPEA